MQERIIVRQVGYLQEQKSEFVAKITLNITTLYMWQKAYCMPSVYRHFSGKYRVFWGIEFEAVAFSETSLNICRIQQEGDSYSGDGLLYFS